jgi:chromosome segregation protein
MERLRTEIHRLDAGEATLAEALDVAEAKLDSGTERLEAFRDESRRLGSQRAAQLARAEALHATAADATRSTEALAGAGIEGVHGSVLDLLDVDAADRIAVATALGPLGAAVAVDADEPLRRAVGWLRSAAGAASLLVTPRSMDDVPSVLSDATRSRLDGAGARALGDVLRPAGDTATARRVVRSVARALGTTYLVADWDVAVALHAQDPSLTFVTFDGDLAGPLGYRIGAVGGAGPAVARAAAAEAEGAALVLEAQIEELAERETVLIAELARRTAERDAAHETLLDSDARLTGAAERLERLGEERRLVSEQRSVLAAQTADIEVGLVADRASHAELEAQEQADPGDDTDDGAALERVGAALDAELEAAREASFEARVSLQRAEDAHDRAAAEIVRLRREADDVDAAHAQAIARREARRAGVARCDGLDRIAIVARHVLERALIEADEARAARLAERERVRVLLEEARESVRAGSDELELHREERHRSEMRRAGVQSRLVALEARIRTELALGLGDVRSEQPDAAALDDARLVEREDVLVRRIGLLGRVNPLALEEFQGLEERHRFLSDQLNDLRRSRRDLEEVITAVDDRIRIVFKEAFDDVAREFEQTFATVFPGGKGRLVLTGADDLLTAGVEVEARPPGKKVQRLSLLSGGERSLTVLAFVFAIFRARPSPFYVLDEVDAALDDVNLQRLLKVVRSFRGHAQIIMVTHQKRSMEIADLLYGITMGPDAVTKVVSERLRDRRAVAALDDRASDAPTEALESDAPEVARRSPVMPIRMG